MSGAEWMMGKVGTKQKRPTPNLSPPEDVTPAEIDDVVTLMNDAAGDGKKLAAGLKGMVSALDRLAECGLTPEAFVLMVHEKCPVRSKAGSRISRETVQAVLEAMFQIGSYLTK